MNEKTITLENKYLISNPVNWLLEKEDPVVRYLTLRDIMQSKTSTDYAALEKSPMGSALLEKNENSVLGDQKNYDILYRGTMWAFAEAVVIGLDRRTDVIKNTGRFIIETYQLPAGGFTLRWSPPTEDACRTGDMLRCLLLAGIEHEGIETCVEWIIRNQRHDGGWLYSPVAGLCDHIKLVLFNKTGRGLSREKDQFVRSSMFATIACAMALSIYDEKRSNGKNNALTNAVSSAAEFILSNLKPGRNTTARQLGFPVLYQYDILSGLTFLARSGMIDQPGAEDLFNDIMARQNSDGSWNLENLNSGMMFGNKPGVNKTRSKWVTLRVLKMLKYAGML